MLIQLLTMPSTEKMNYIYKRINHRLNVIFRYKNLIQLQINLNKYLIIYIFYEYISFK